MSTTMNTAAIRSAAVASAVEKMGLANLATQIDTNEYVIPVEIDGKTRYVSNKLSVKNDKDTKTTTAFDLDEAVEMWEEKKAEAAEKAAKSKKGKKSSSRRKKSSNEDENEDEE